MSWEWGNGMPREPQRCGKPPGRCPIHGQESSGVEIGRPSQLQVIQMVRYSSFKYVCKRTGTQGAPIAEPGSLRQDSIWGRCLDGKVARRTQVCLPISNHHSTSPEQASKMGRGPHHDHILLARSELLPRDYAANKEPPKHL